MDRPDEHRSRTMRAVKSKDTRPERIVRQLAHGMGYRYRLHRKDLPGKPDLVFGPRRKVVFVHGCFWHQHDAGSCRGGRVPKLREEYWRPKLERNKARDALTLVALEKAGWAALVLWECELKDRESVKKRLQGFLGLPGKADRHE